MFHQTKDGPGIPQRGAEKTPPGSEETRIYQPYQSPAIEQSAVERYAKLGKDVSVPPANQNQTTNQTLTENLFYVYESPIEQEEKDTPAMSTPEENKTEAKADAPIQSAPSRIDIPGGVFQRPGQPLGTRVPGAYPGAYPGAATTSYGVSSTPAVAAADGRNRLNIGQGITLSGEIESCDHLIVEGTVEAALKGASVLEIAETGAFFGTVEIDEATIAGRFEGDLTVRGRLTIKATGSITGAISYKELAVEAGATLDGKVNPLDSKNASANNRKVADAKARKPMDTGAELPFNDSKAVAAG